MNAAQDQIESLAFRLQHAPGVGAATLRSILRRMQQEGLDASAFLNLEDRELQGRFKVKTEACDFLRRHDDSLDAKWLQLEKMGVHVLVDGQPGYPARLNRTLAGSAPPVLYAMGNLDLLESPSVGFGGSRKASEKGIKITEDSSMLLARQGINVVSGYAQGVDLAAHRAALEAGGSTTLVLAEGMLHFRIKEDLRRFFDEEALSHVLILSEFPPSLAWKAHSAMARNQTICGLSDAMVIIESGPDGGTFEAGKTAMDLRVPLFCVAYASPPPSAAGNTFFLQHGASPIKQTRDGLPNLAGLLAVLSVSPMPSAILQTSAPEFSLREDQTPYRTKSKS
jgi:DNA protecting protein DprA